MNKYKLYFALALTSLLAVHLLFYRIIFKSLENFHGNKLLEMVSIEAYKLETDFENLNIQRKTIISSGENSFEDIMDLSNKNEAYKALEDILINNKGLISNIKVYDNKSNALNLSYNAGDKILTDLFLMQNQIPLFKNESCINKEQIIEYIDPVYNDNNLVYNIIYSVDLNQYFNNKLEWTTQNEDCFNTIISEEGLVLAGNGPIKAGDKLLPLEIQDGKNYLSHILNSGSENLKLLSAVSSVSLYMQEYTLLFSMNTKSIFKTAGIPFIATGFSSAIIVSALGLLFLLKFRKISLNTEILSNECSDLNSILNNLPVAIMILTMNNKTVLINDYAKKMLMIKDDEDLINCDFSGRFILSGNYFDSYYSGVAFDSNQFMVYAHEGKEISIFRQDTPYKYNNEDFILSALIDITVIEKSRKYEAAANTAKSDFLAKMSHEIRTPMNGIIGMSEILYNDGLTEQQKEYLDIVKRSADLLLSLVDDILDFSKIEAGKMQIEEIPFRLRDEVKLILNLFKPIVSEKKIKLNFIIEPGVPDRIISDPYRLRQILTNLLSNAVKFTHEGEINVGVELEDQHSRNLTLRFYVEDTGVGIPRNKIETIFNSFTQADESISRKYGGSGLGTTISKQLVNLLNGEIWVESPSPSSTNSNFPGSKFIFTIEAYSNELPFKNLPFSDINYFSDIKSLVILPKFTERSHLFKILDLFKIKYEPFIIKSTNSNEIIELLNNSLSSYHLLIIIDNNDLNGIELAKNLKAHKLTDKFIILMYGINHNPQKHLLSKLVGIDYYFEEPIEAGNLSASICESFHISSETVVHNMNQLPKDLSILVAEDNEINIKVAESVFSRLGYSVMIARNGIEAIKLAKENHFDVIFMDIIMPECDGEQATKKIRAMGLQMPVIAMTASAGAKSKSKALASGMNDYLIKPFKTDQLMNIMLKWFT